MVSWTRPPLVMTSSTMRIFSLGEILKPRRRTSLPSSFSTKMNRDLSWRATYLAEDKSAHGGGDYGDGGEGTDFGGEGGAEFLDGGHLLEGEGALEKAAAVEPAAQDEMAVEQGAGVAEDLEDFVFGHGQDGRNKG